MYNSHLPAEENTSQGAKEVADYTVYKDQRNGIETHVINFDNPKYAPFEGIVELYPIKVAKGIPNQTTGAVPFRHKASVNFSVCRDRATGIFIGIPNGWDHKTGQIMWERHTFNDVEFLDLSIPAQRKKYICFKYGPFYEKSPNLGVGLKTTYGVVDRIKDDENYMANRQTKKKASEIAESLHGEQLEDFALTLGIDPKMYSPFQLSVQVVKFAENEQKVAGKTGAQRFMDAWNSDFREELIILKRGISVGLVTDTPNNGIAYMGITLGFSEIEAVKYLKEHPSTAISIDTQARGKQSHSTSHANPKPAVLDEKDAVIANLKKQLEEATKSKAKSDEIALDAVSTNVIADQSPELAELLATWKGKIAGIHLIARTKPIEERLKAVQDKVNEHLKSVKN